MDEGGEKQKKVDSTILHTHMLFGYMLKLLHCVKHIQECLYCVHCTCLFLLCIGYVLYKRDYCGK